MLFSKRKLIIKFEATNLAQVIKEINNLELKREDIIEIFKDGSKYVVIY